MILDSCEILKISATFEASCGTVVALFARQNRSWQNHQPVPFCRAGW
jgi:hypothetical protein